MRAILPLLGLLAPAFCGCIHTPSVGCGTTFRPPPVALFNGRDLTGWRSWLVDSGTTDPRRVFRVHDGILHITGDGLGYLGSTASFTNYRLTVVWRWGQTNTAWGDRIGKARDSGVFLHATGPDGNSHDGNGAFRAALECNLFQGATGDLLLIRGNAADGTLIAPTATVHAAAARDADGWPTWDPEGEATTLRTWGRVNHRGKSRVWRDVIDFRHAHDAEHPRGAWNTLVCDAFEGRLRFTLNRVVVNEVSDVWPRHGSVLLQCEGSEIHFRQVNLQELDSWPEPPERAPPHRPAGRNHD